MFVSLNLYINSCVLDFYALVFFFLDMRHFGECEPFFFLKRDFYRNMNATEQNSCLLNTVHSASFLFLVLPMKQPECSPPHPQREHRNVFCSVHVFEFKALYVNFFFLFCSCLV